MQRRVCWHVSCMSVELPSKLEAGQAHRSDDAWICSEVAGCVEIASLFNTHED